MPKRAFILAALFIVPASVSAGGRYYVNSLWSWGPEAKDSAYVREYIDESKKLGFNAFSTDVGWGILREDGTHDWEQFDRTAEYALSQGLNLFVRVNTSLYSKPYWLTDEHLACEKSGEPFIDPRPKLGIPSISNPEVLRRAAAFYRALTSHCRERFGSGRVVCFSAAFTLYMESEYWEQIDYSAAAKADFLEWAKREYASVSSLNEKWGTHHKSRQDIDLVTAHQTAQELYFEYSLKRFLDTMSSAAKEGDPKAKFGMQTGCIWDCWWRRTMNCAGLLENCDWLFVADAPTYPHGWTCDYLRGVAQDKVRVSNEIDGPYLKQLTNERILNQGVETWDHCVDTVIVCNWKLDNLKDPKFTALGELGKLAKKPAKAINADRAIYVSAWDIIHGDGHGLYEQFYNGLADKASRPVDIIHDSVFDRRPEVLKRYEEIYLPRNKRIPEASRRALLTVKDRLRISKPSLAGTADEYNRPTRSLTEEMASDAAVHLRRTTGSRRFPCRRDLRIPIAAGSPSGDGSYKWANMRT